MLPRDNQLHQNRQNNDQCHPLHSGRENVLQPDPLESASSAGLPILGIEPRVVLDGPAQNFVCSSLVIDQTQLVIDQITVQTKSGETDWRHLNGIFSLSIIALTSKIVVSYVLFFSVL